MAAKLIATDIRELLPMRRSPGNHVSEIINRLCVKLGKWEPRESGSRPAQIQFEVGNAMEDAIATGLAGRFHRDQPDRYVHGLELEMDGITGNADLLDTVDFVVEECKLTKYSLNRVSKDGIDGEWCWHYWVQLKAYCWMIGADTGRLHITFVNGNYKYDSEDPNSGWQYRVWEEKWRERDLAPNWRMLVGHKLELEV